MILTSPARTESSTRINSDLPSRHRDVSSEEKAPSWLEGVFDLNSCGILVLFDANLITHLFKRFFPQDWLSQIVPIFGKDI